MGKTIIEMTKEEREENRKASMAHRQAAVDSWIQHSSGVAVSFFKSIPKTYQWGWIKSIQGIGTKTDAIKAKCLECSNYQQQEVTSCTVISCPLMKYRPFQKKEVV